MPITSLQELFIHELSDIYNAEKRLMRDLPRLAGSVHDARLAESLAIHIAEAGAHVDRIDQVIETLDVWPRRGRCAAIEAMVEDLRDIVDVIDPGSLRDIALLAGIQRLIRHQVAAHGIVVTLARRLDYRDVLPALLHNLDEKTASDERLARLAAGSPQQNASMHAA